MTLFDDDPEPKSGAIISACGLYRYHLWRIWNPDLPTMVFVMQNPSTADADQDDPTIRRCIAFAKRDRCGSISVRNVFALRATDERLLLTHPDPMGPENIDWLCGARGVSLMTRLVVAWGTRLGGKRFKSSYQRAEVALLPQEPWCLGVTKEGHPRHPLFVRGDAEFVRWWMPEDDRSPRHLTSAKPQGVRQ